MRVLIIGGTKFLGVHLTEALAARGHEVTHFNRGKTGVAPAGVRTVRGDRTRGFEVLKDERFDAVVDTSGYFPDVVERSAGFFESRAGHYVFVSSVSVYEESVLAPDEESPLQGLPEGASRSEMPPGYETYGALKALCEAVVAKAFHNRATILRPGLIAGPLDPTDRFTYWPVRFARGGDVLLPGSPLRSVQFVDVRDVADFAATAMERGTGGVFNVTSPQGGFSMSDVERACARVTNVPYKAYYASDAFLLERGVVPWTGLPLWLAPGEHPGLVNVATHRATAAGLKIRALEQTVRDTLAWGAGRRSEAWLAARREAELISELRELP